MPHPDCNLDQWLTSAMAAMKFAVDNWPAFCDHTSVILGRPVPIGADTMIHHADHLSRLCDPESMPDD
jgi:hypothetical protein